MRFRSVLFPVIFVTAAVAPVISIPAPTAPPVPPDGSIRAYQKELDKRQFGLPTPTLKLASVSASPTTSFIKPSANVYFQGLEDMSGMGIAADKFYQDFKDKDKDVSLSWTGTGSPPAATAKGFVGNWQDKLNWSVLPNKDATSDDHDDDTSVSNGGSAPDSPSSSSHGRGHGHSSSSGSSESVSDGPSDPSSSSWQSKGKMKSNLKRGSESD